MRSNARIIRNIAAGFLAALFVLAFAGSAFAASAPHVESSDYPEQDHDAIPLGGPMLGGSHWTGSSWTQDTSSNSGPSAGVNAFAASQTQTQTPQNLIQNPSVEQKGGNGDPVGWFTGGYGKNIRRFIYPVTDAEDGSYAIGVQVFGYDNGDAKWYFADVSVAPGTTYNFSDYYLSNVPTELDARFTMQDGSYVYKYLATVPPTGLSHGTPYARASAQFTPPAGAVSVTIFHLIQSNGALITDNYSLSANTPPPPPASGNLIPNGDLGNGTSGDPTGWSQGGWGTNARTFAYPVAGPNGMKGAQVTISSYTSGDAKWYFDPIALTPDVYTYTDQYESNVPSELDVQFQNADGSYSYQELALVPSSSSFATASGTFTVPAGTQNVTVFHLIAGVGTLTIGNATLTLDGSATAGVFATGAVTLRFDDGWDSQWNVAVPAMEKAGLPGTFYIVTHQVLDDGFSGFMSIAQIKQLPGLGMEVGAHTRTHPDLTTLTQAQQIDEIDGSKQDLQSWGIDPVTFAYPYGAYNAQIIQEVKDAGFAAAAATIDGYVTPSSDPYQLERQGVTIDVTAPEAEQWIQTAMQKHEWLILLFHRIDTSGDQYSTTPQTFQAIVDYLAANHIPVVTIEQGIKSLP